MYAPNDLKRLFPNLNVFQEGAYKDCLFFKLDLENDKIFI